MELSTRRVHVARITPSPDGRFMLQAARNLTDPFDGFLLERQYLILERDGKYTEEFRRFLTDAGTTIVKLPTRPPNLNAYAEHFVLSIKSECLDRMIFFTERASQRAIRAYFDHYDRERTHQGRTINRSIEEAKTELDPHAPVRCHKRLGGLLRYYHRHAA